MGEEKLNEQIGSLIKHNGLDRQEYRLTFCYKYPF